MDWKNLTISNIRRLVAALEKANPRLLESLIAREPNEVVPHGRVTVESLLNLLEQTGGSTVLPEEMVQQLQRPETPAVMDLTIDCDAEPAAPPRFKIFAHKSDGQLVWDPTKVELYLIPGQQKSANGSWQTEKAINIYLALEFDNKKILNATVLDWLLTHPDQIPATWKGQKVNFWGTVYSDIADNRYIRYLSWQDNHWCGTLRRVSDLTGNVYLDSNEPAAILISNQTALPPENIINCDARPTVPENLKLSSHQPGGQFVWDPTKVELFLAPGQQRGADGSWQIEKTTNIRLALENAPKQPLNANVLDWLLAHPEQIPETWKSKNVLFWGTIYSDILSGQHVRYLHWHTYHWVSRECDINSDWCYLDGFNPAAVLTDTATQTATRPVIDCTAEPFMRADWKLKAHHQDGLFVFDPTRVTLMRPSENDDWPNGQLQNPHPLNASVLKYLMEHQELIPEEWKGKAIYFRGTTYEDKRGISLVPHLFWIASIGWQWDCHTIDHPAIWNDDLSRFAVHR